MIFKNRLDNQHGQALLIIVLIMVIALTVGLSIATRSIINLKNTTDQANSQKALAAAEAGVEEALKSGTPVDHTIYNSFPRQGGTSSTTSYVTSVSQQDVTGNFLINSGDEIAKNDAIYVWVKPYTSDRSLAFTNSWTGSELDIFWGSDKNDACNNAALEVAIIYGTKAAPNLKRVTIDPCPARRAVNSFGFGTSTSQTTTTINKQALQYKTILTPVATGGDLPANILLIRINPIYMSATIGVYGNPPLAPQGKIITSQGTSDQNTTRKITVFEGYPEVPAEFFPYNLFQP